MSGLFTDREAKILKYIDKFVNDIDNKTIQGEVADGDYRLYDENKFDPTGWLIALRDGSYKQARGYLCVVDDAIVDQEAASVSELKCSYCCLGVLLDVTSNGWQDEESSLLLIDEEREEDESVYYLADQIHNVFDDGNGSLIDSGYAYEMGLFEVAQVVLAGLNDAGATFEEIATVIEANDCRAVLDLADKIKGQ